MEHPPGTLKLEQLLSDETKKRILHPTPTTDPNDPLNWSKGYKALNFGLVCYYTFMIFVNLDIGTVIWGALNIELGIPFEILSISFGVNTAGLAVGCVLFIPLALKFGRRPIYLVSIIVSLGSSIWQARAMTSGDILGANLVSGLAGAISETICQMTIADMFFVHQRGATNALFLFVTLIGVFLAPVAAGYSAASQGWRWIWWWASILLGVCFVLFVFLYEDTKYIPAPSGQPLRQERVASEDESSIQKGSHVDELQVQAVESYDTPIDTDILRKSYWQRLSLTTTTDESLSTFLKYIYEPFIILFTFPAITYTALTYGSLLAWFSVVVNVYSVYFTLPPYNFGAEGIGLLNLAPFVGGALGSIYSGIAVDRSIIWLSHRNGGIFEPEMRLWSALPGVVLMPLSILMFGLATAYGTHWSIPAVGLGIFGFGFTALADVALTYAMDCYTTMVGRSFIAIVFVRNAFATIIATTLTQWIAGVGFTNMIIMSTVLAFALSALTIPFMVWGKKFRVWTMPRLERMTQGQFDTRE